MVPSRIKNANAEDEENVNVLQLPINDAYKELLKPFVMRQRGEIVIPHDYKIINSKYWFHNHHHRLSLISLEENDDDDNDNDDFDHSRRSELICDGCTTPIYQKKLKSASSSQKYDNYYMSCGECKYFLHWACFQLPPELPFLPVHHENDHKLILLTCPKLQVTMQCDTCNLHMNGLFYACTECRFKVDIKCASLPNTIKHAAHPKHHLYLIRLPEMRTVNCFCGACGYLIWGWNYYECSSCEFCLHTACALLPATNKHRWDKHPLLLTWDANVNHPSEFYCDICETEMNPKTWMYHCRECDQSFHPDCFPTTSGSERNVKLGQQYAFTFRHPHPLTYQIITKNCCDFCHRLMYGKVGFQCASCSVVMCSRICVGFIGYDEGAIQAVD